MPIMEKVIEYIKNSNGINLISRKTSNEDLYYLYVSVKDFTSTKNIILLVKLSKH